MKKLFVVGVMFVMTMSSMIAGEFQFSWNPTLEQAKSMIVAARNEKNTFNAAVMNVFIQFRQKQNVTYDEFCSMVDKAVDEEYAQESEDVKNCTKIQFKKQIPLCNQSLGFTKEAWQFCKQNPSGYDIYYVLAQPTKLGITDDESFERLSTYVMTKTFDKGKYDLVMKIVTKIIDLSVNQKEDAVKTLLKKMNRKLSPMLIADKANWEPIVAKIRTAMETY